MIRYSLQRLHSIVWIVNDYTYLNLKILNKITVHNNTCLLSTETVTFKMHFQQVHNIHICLPIHTDQLYFVHVDILLCIFM